MIGIINRDQQEVSVKHIEVLGPARHQAVAQLGIAVRSESAVKHAAESVYAGALLLVQQSAGEVLELEIDEVVVQVLLGTQALQVPVEYRDRILQGVKVLHN